MAMFQSVWEKLKNSFQKIRSQLGSKIRHLFSKKAEETSFEHLEKLLFEADLGSSLSLELVDKVRDLFTQSKDPSQEEVIDLLKEELLALFDTPNRAEKKGFPHVVLLVGVNGSGKTTSTAKLAEKYKQEGKKVLLAACDTFRAAAIEQLQKWANQIGVDIVCSKPHSDPSSVAFDAISSAIAKKHDVVLLDTAGRLHTKVDLMKELNKIYRVCQKKLPEAPHETLLVLDGTTGQNALDQARLFHKFVPLTGIILTKLEGTAKGGIVAAIKRELQLDTLWVGMGEKKEDLLLFEPKAFVEALLQ